MPTPRFVDGFNSAIWRPTRINSETSSSLHVSPPAAPDLGFAVRPAP